MKEEDGNRRRKKNTSEHAGSEKSSELQDPREVGEGFPLLEQCLLSDTAAQINTTVIYTSIHSLILHSSGISTY